jgi:hypothetical protein
MLVLFHLLGFFSFLFLLFLSLLLSIAIERLQVTTFLTLAGVAIRIIPLVHFENLKLATCLQSAPLVSASSASGMAVSAVFLNCEISAVLSPLGDGSDVQGTCSNLPLVPERSKSDALRDLAWDSPN